MEIIIDLGENDKFIKEFEEESDRASVILAGAKLDTMLYQLLIKILLPSPTAKDELLDGDGPLSTFSSRINASYRLGIIDAKFSKALHLIRRIRNSFAHELSGGTLDSGTHRDRVKELFLLFDKLHSQEFEKIYAYKKRWSAASAEFRISIAIMILRLEFAIQSPMKINNNIILTLGGQNIIRDAIETD